MVLECKYPPNAPYALVRPLMYSFGDDVNPDPEATNVLEEILIDFIMEICYKSQKASGNRGKIKIEDIKFVLRNDTKKLNRVEELLYMQEDIKRARAAFNEGDIIQDAVKANGNKKPAT